MSIPRQWILMITCALFLVALMVLAGCGDVRHVDLPMDGAEDSSVDESTEDSYSDDVPLDTEEVTHDATEVEQDVPVEHDVPPEYLYRCECYWGGYYIDYEACATDADEAVELTNEACAEAHPDLDPCDCSDCVLVDIC